MTNPMPGTLLIADPFLKDPNFKRTVVFMCEHQAQGSFGFVINKICDHTLDELMNNVDAGLKIPVFYGGPVQMDTIHFLHQYPAIPGSQEVSNGIYWGGDFDLTIDLIKKGEIDQSNIRFYLGYSGWSEGQLEEELNQKSWLTGEATRRVVFHRKAEEIWGEALKDLGGDYKMMVNFPIDPQLN